MWAQSTSFSREINPHLSNHFSANIILTFLIMMLSHWSRNLEERKTILEAEQMCEITRGWYHHVICTDDFLYVLSVQSLSHYIIQCFSEWKQ